MRKITFIFAIVTLIFAANAFGQNQRTKRKSYTLPEVGDEVLVAFRKKRTTSKMRNGTKSSHDKYANQEVSFRKKPKLKKRGITHDPEFENWARRKNKTTKIRRKNK